MTFQTINLYQDVLKPPRKPREDVLLATASVACLVGFLAYSGWLFWSFNRLGAAVKSAEDSKLTLEASVEALRAQLGGRRADPLLVQENERLKGQIKKADLLVGLIEQNQVLETGNIAFAEILRAYARNSQENIWLDQIQVADAGRELQLSGVFSRQEALTDFLSHLKGDASFVGRSFNHMDVKPEETDKRLHRFTLDTRLNLKEGVHADVAEAIPSESPIEELKQFEADDE